MLSGCACPARAISTFSSDIAYSRSPAASGALQALGSVGEHLGVKVAKDRRLRAPTCSISSRMIRS
jgi:hypothetical protein